MPCTRSPQLWGALLSAALLGLVASAAASDPGAPAGTQLAALEKLGTASHAQAQKGIAALLESGQSDAVTERALELLGQLGAPLDAKARIQLELYTHHRRVAARARAYAALGLTHDPGARPLVERGLRDAAPEVRGASARALSELRAKDSVGLLLRALARGVPQAADAIGLLGDAASVAHFDEQLGKVPLPVMLGGYEAFLLRTDLDVPTKLGIVAKLEDVGGDAVRSLFVRLATRRELKTNAAVSRALEASIARLTPHAKAKVGEPQ